MARMGAELPQFISEPIEPVAGTFDAGAMSRGERGCRRDSYGEKPNTPSPAWREAGKQAPATAANSICDGIGTKSKPNPDSASLYIANGRRRIETSRNSGGGSTPCPRQNDAGTTE